MTHLRSILLIATALAITSPGREAVAVSDKPEEAGQMLFDFAEGDTSAWTAVNDGVMGGVSLGQSRISEDNTLLFSGSVSFENNGGFASIRSRTGSYDLSSYDGLTIRIRGDGNKYALTMQTDVFMMAGSYRTKFSTGKDTWQEIDLPFADFEATSFGQVMRNAPPLDPGKTRQFGFLISDKQAGPFKLEVDWIQTHGARESDPLIAAPDKPTAARNLIELAIMRGVPLFNAGQPEACTAIYEVTAQSLIAMASDDLPPSCSERLTSALGEAARITDDSERAWVLRRALDFTLESLPAKQTRAKKTASGTTTPRG